MSLVCDSRLRAAPQLPAATESGRAESQAQVCPSVKTPVLDDPAPPAVFCRFHTVLRGWGSGNKHGGV